MSITVKLQELTGLDPEDRAGSLLWCRLAIKQPTSLRFGRSSAVACSASGDGFFGEEVVFTGLASAPGTLVVDVWSGKHQRGVQLHDLREAVGQWTGRYEQRAWLRQLEPWATHQCRPRTWQWCPVPDPFRR